MIEQWQPLLEQMRSADKPDDVLKLLAQMDTCDEDTRWRLLSTGLERLWDLDYPEFEVRLIEECVLRSGYEAMHVHSVLKRWLRDQLSEKRNAIVERLTGYLDAREEATVQNTLWTLIVIGFRDQELEKRLVSIVTKPGDRQTRHIGLWGMVALGYLNVELIEKYLAKELQEPGKVPELICRCGRHLRSVRLLPHFIERLNEARVEDEDQLSNLLYVLADTAMSYSECASTVWDAILRKNAEASTLASLLTWYGEIPNRIADRRVAEYFVEALASYETVAPAADRIMPQYRLYLLLSGLVLPEHLEGVGAGLDGVSTDVQLRARQLLHNDATMDTGYAGPAQKERTLLKEACWEAILRLDLPEATAWLVEALQETNPFVAARICNLAGFCRISEAVPHLARLVARDDWDKDGGLHTALGLAAIRALGNIGTAEAFDALAASRFSFENRWPGKDVAETTPVDYPTAIAACVIGMNDAERLVEYIERGPIEPGTESGTVSWARRWIGCAIAADTVGAVRPALLAPFRDRLIQFVQRNMTKGNVINETGNLRFVISILGAYGYDAETAKLLKARAGERDVTAIYCLEALARWKALADNETLFGQLGLVCTDGQWHRGEPMGPREAFVTGLLFDAEPTMFAPAICDIISKGSFQQVVQVLQRLSKQNTTADVTDEIAKRAHRINSAIMAEDEVLRTLRRIAPNRFVSEFPSDEVKNWRASARESIVREYAGLEGGLAVMPLCEFLTDPAFVVRRCAARALAEIDDTKLLAQVVDLANSPDPERRGYAVEAAVYLGDDEEFRRLIRSAREDRELVVRNAAIHAEDDRRSVELARRYTKSICSSTADELPSVWKYGQALIQIGDDETISTLQSKTHDLMPNQQAYVSSLCEEIKKRWSARQKDRASQYSEW